MGNSKSVDLVIRDHPERDIFVTYKEMNLINGIVGRYMNYTFVVRYQRFIWNVYLRYNDLVQLDKVLLNKYSTEMEPVIRPRKYNKIIWNHDKQFLEERARLMTKYLQDLADRPVLRDNRFLRKALNISAASFLPELGRKGMEGFLHKCSGGYVEKFSRKAGDFISFWQYRWVVLHETCIGWYKNEHDPVMIGNLRIDQAFACFKTGRVVTVVTETRKIVFKADTSRSAHVWWQEINDFYGNHLRIKPQFFESSFPPRLHCDVKAYTYPRDYMAALAISLLGAQKEILITSWKNSPTVILTRPPFPTLRLDQILQYKAQQGVKVYVLLYKEVDYVGQSNDSLRSKSYLESLHSNIRAIRHPNKFVGGATAVLWSHHEKTVVIDRNLCFVGGIDLAFQRWDDEKHRVADEEGLIYPGPDYRNPAPGVFKKLREAPDPNSIEEDEEMIEVEVAMPGEQLPQAASTSMMDPDNDTCEVEVVVDFGVDFSSNITTESMIGRTSTATKSATPSAPVVRTSVGMKGDETDSTAVYEPNGKTSVNIFDPRKRADTQSSDEKSVGYDDPSQQFTKPSQDAGRTTMPVIPEGNSAPTAARNDLRESGDECEVDDDIEEDRNIPETAEEREAVLLVTAPSNVESELSMTSAGDSLDKDSECRVTNMHNSISNSLASTGRKMKSTFERAVTHMREQYQGRTTAKRAPNLEPRDMYPRMPWHDLSCAVTGTVARDVASHFIQRWNHHRLSAAQYAEPVLNDITDEECWGVCARCRTHNISDRISDCPTCGNDLGSINGYSLPDNPNMWPPLIDEKQSYLVFECKFAATSKLPFQMQGDCPVVITALLQKVNRRTSDASYSIVGDSSTDSASWTNERQPHARAMAALDETSRVSDDQSAGSMTGLESSVSQPSASNGTVKNNHLSNDANGSHSSFDVPEEGVLIDLAGPRAEWLTSFGLVPAVGDVILAVDGSAVTQLNSNQLKRFIKMRRRSLSNQYNPKQSADQSESSTASVPVVSILFRRHYLENLYPIDRKHEMSVDGVIGPFSSDNDLSASAEKLLNSSAPHPAPPAKFSADTSENNVSQSNEINVAPDADENVTKPLANMKVGSGNDQIGSSEGAVPVAVAVNEAAPEDDAEADNSCAVKSALSFLPFQRNENKVRQYHPSCHAAAQQEIHFAMSQLFHNYRRNFDVPQRLPDGSGTCKVQLLRSVGKWSTGTKNECSILRCYTESIKAAKHLVYIESQFFIGDTAGEGVANDIPSVLAERILRAHANREAFRVIVIIPVHPNGDFVSASKAKVVMHFEYATINRGLGSLFERLKKNAPDISISKYIGFFSLRNWGVINGKVVSDQVYVHDKLMITDDRVAIIGSANINDRSMLGMRDSEVAVRVEDTLHIDIFMNRQPFAVGYFPHMLRTRLMRQHLGVDESVDVSDVFSESVMKLWTHTAQSNSSLYDSIDGGISYYRCSTIAEFTNAFANYRNPSYYDPDVRQRVELIKGFLVDWPRDLFCKEDLSPSLATRTIIPNELWV